MEIEKIFKNDVDSIADNIFGVVNNSVSEAREMQKRKVAENVQLVVQALKKMESDIRDRYDSLTKNIENRVMTIKDGRDGINGKDGKDGKDGRPGRDGKDGRPGSDGKDGAAGRDGNDGVSVTNAKLDFDNSLVIYLSNGQEINVGEIMPFDVAEKIKVITNGGGTSQSVLDTLTSLQTQINALSSFGEVSYQGTWNASTNSPTITSGSGTKGYYYVVSTAGSTTIDGESLWGVGDWIVYNGSVWQKVDGGSTGNLTTLDVSTSATFSYGTANGLLYLNGSKVATSGSGLTFDGSSMVLDTSTSSTALRITQTGTGNALLVEDSANPDSTPFVIDASGQVITGHTTAIPFTYASVPRIEMVGTSQSSSSFATTTFNSTAGAPSALLLGRGRGTVASPTAVSSGDDIGLLQFEAHDGTALIPAASILAKVDGTPGTNDMPGRLVFSTTADGASSPTERIRVDSTGQTKFSYNTVVEVTDNTNAALRITQTGTGNALLVEDSTNPDSTPLVIDANGRVILGHTSSQTFGGETGIPFQINGTTQATSSEAFANWANNSFASTLFFNKSRGESVGTYAPLISGDAIGSLQFEGSDGTNFIVAANIQAQVDATVSTNDMPGRLVFSTTADGASSLTERMRIDSAGVQRQFGPLVVSNTLANNVTYNFSFDVSGQEAGASSIAFRPDGKMMYVLGTGSDDITYYSLSTAWDITTATHVGQSNATSTQNGTPQGMFFKPDGTKVFIVGTAAPAGVWAYSCAAPWDVSTLTYDSVTKDLSAITTAPLGIWFKPDGTKMYIASNTGGVATYTDTILEYSLSTAWDVSSATSTTYFSVASQDTAPAGVQFTEDGLRMFVCGSNGDTVVVYDLSTAWDINTATFKYETSNLSTLVGTAITPTDIFIQPNGQTLYVLSDTGSGAGTNMVYQFTAASPATINLTGNTTISGNTTVNQDLTVRGATNSSGNVLVTGFGGLGYGTGSGGAVTQATSRTTGVTLNKTNGAITLVSAAGSTTWQSFTVTNSTVAATDTIIVNQKSGTDLYQIFVTNVAAGSFRISFATTGGTTTEQPVFNFAVIKAVTA